MACQIPDSLHAALFSLKPVGDNATRVVNSDRNKHLHFDRALYAGQVSSKMRAPGDTRYVATIGRNGDIAIPSEFSSISRIHCSFLVKNNRVSFQFNPRSSRVYGPGGQRLGNNSYRVDDTYSRVDRKDGVDICSIELGKTGEETFRFIVRWNYDIRDTASRLRAWWEMGLPTRPSMAETQRSHFGADEGRTKPYRDVAQIEKTMRNCGNPRVERRGRLGQGAYGNVFEGVNLDTGEVIAIKELRRSAKRGGAALGREFQIHSALRHPNVVQFIGGRGWEAKDGPLEIYMALKHGTLEDLIKREVRPADGPLAADVYFDLLQALDYIHCKGFIHRDVKPENVLFALKDGKFCFQIADFGLSNDHHLARTYCGTPLYMAPEVNSGRKQTTAVDMWSLFVTLLWVEDVEGFRSKEFGTYLALLFWIVGAASRNWEGSGTVQGLTVLDYTRRASAAQILVTFFDGEGMTTPRRNVRPWEPPLQPPSEQDVILFGLPSTSRVARRRNVAAPTQLGPVCTRNKVNKAALKPLEQRPAKPPLRNRWWLLQALVWPGHDTAVATPAADVKSAGRKQMPGGFPIF